MNSWYTFFPDQVKSRVHFTEEEGDGDVVCAIERKPSEIQVDC